MQYSGNFLLLLLAYLHYDFSNHVSVTKERKVPRHLLLPSNTYSRISFLPQLYRVSGNLASYLRVFVAPTLSANVSCIGYSKVHFHLFLSLAVFFLHVFGIGESKCDSINKNHFSSAQKRSRVKKMQTINM